MIQRGSVSKIKFNGFTALDFPKAKELWLDKGDVFLYEGDTHRETCYLLMQGKLDVRLISGSGHETLLYHLTEGDLVGELSMFGVAARTATVVANSRACLLEVAMPEFKERMQDYDFLQKVTLHFLNRYLRTHDVVCRLGQPNIGMKLCHYFKSIIEHNTDNTGEMAIHLPSHSTLGKLLSCQRESVTRELKKLVNAGILSQIKGSNYMLNIENMNLYLGGLLD
jgi:CRP-like cAMP-binding protein